MKKVLLYILISALTSLTACGSSSPGDTLEVNIISGTAATGAAVSGTVYVRDSLGEAGSCSIEDDGTYSIDVAGMTGPFILYAEGASGTGRAHLYSYTTEAGRANVTPITTAILAHAIGDNPETAYPPDEMKGSGRSRADISSDDIENATDEFIDILDDTYISFGLDRNFDPMTGEFTANGTGADKMLDILDVNTSVSDGTTIVTITSSITGNILLTDDVTNSDIEVSGTLVNDIAGSVSDLDKIRVLFDKTAELFNRGADVAWENINTEEEFAAKWSELSPDFKAICYAGNEEIGEFMTMLSLGFQKEDTKCTIEFRVQDFGKISDTTLQAFSNGSLNFSSTDLEIDGIYVMGCMNFILRNRDDNTTVSTMNYPMPFIIKQGEEWDSTTGNNWRLALDPSDKYELEARLDALYYNRVTCTGGTFSSEIFGGMLCQVRDDSDEGVQPAIAGSSVDAVIILGDGINKSLTGAEGGPKGLLFTYAGDGEYEPVNFDNGSISSNLSNPGILYREAEGGTDDLLDLDDIRDLRYRFIAYHNNGTSFEPIASWACNFCLAVPLKASGLSATAFPVLRGDTPASMDDLKANLDGVLASDNDWTVPFEFSVPGGAQYLRMVGISLNGTATIDGASESVNIHSYLSAEDDDEVVEYDQNGLTCWGEEGNDDGEGWGMMESCPEYDPSNGDSLESSGITRAEFLIEYNDSNDGTYITSYIRE